MSITTEWYKAQLSQMTADLIALCNLNSGSDSLPGLVNVANWLEKYFQPLGVEPQRIALPNYSLIDDLGQTTVYETGPVLRWDFDNPNKPRAVGRPRILMTIHYDTVYGPTSLFQQCTQLNEDQLRGPGVIDAKGGIVVMRTALLGAKLAGILDQVDVTAILTPDEEIGSPSSSSYWNQIASQFDFAMLYEPSMADNALVSTRKGTGTFVFVVHGRSAHAGRNFTAGRNAVVHAARIAIELSELNGKRPDVTVNVGRFRGGDAVNVVPDLAVIRANVRLNSADDQQWLELQIKSIANKFNNEVDGYRVELSGGVHSAPKLADEATQRWMKRVEFIGQQIGESIQWKASGGASDGNKLFAMGLPNIDTFGPEGDLLHSDQEWVRLSSLPRKAALSAALLADIAQRGNASVL